MGNGGVTDKYSWTQTLQDVQVSVGVPAAIKGRDIVCDISGSHIKFGLRGQDPIVDAPLAKPVKADDCYWTLESSGASRTLDIYLQKANGMEWWNCIAEGEPTIDTSKVEPESSKLEDLDAETRKTVEKMMFDQRQKMMNKPTSDEMRKQEMLQRFMAQHPEMDFSQAKIQ
ncbi:BOB1 [Symbiodinium sp. KB8]|nr:BOB1 [Symbiodinium sp. KB8]